MRFIQHHLRLPTHIQAGAQAGSAFQAFLSQGRGIQVSVPDGWLSVCWPISGTVMLSADSTYWLLAGRQHQCWWGSALHATSVSSHGWLLITGPREAWLALPSPTGAMASNLYPWQSEVSRDLGHALLSVVRACMRTPDEIPLHALGPVVSGLMHAQAPLNEALIRCAGRTTQQKQANLVRLLQIHHHVRHNLEHRPNLHVLSRISDYSPAYLIRAFRRVFGETPAEFSNRMREQDAWRLVTSTKLPIQDIATRLGYGNQSAFCRLFKAVFGITTTQARL